MAYGLDFDTGLTDTFNMIFNGYAYLVMMYILRSRGLRSPLVGGSSHSPT